MSIARLAVLAAIVAVVAVEIPRRAPDFLEDIVDEPAAPVVETEPEPAPAPPVAVEEPRPPRREFARQVSLDADARGHFLAEVRINGMGVTVMVDTGATSVALTEATARRLAIYPGREDYTDAVRTANGMVPVAPVMLTEIRLGNIAVRNVEAVIVPGDALGTNLLGMTFLKRLSRFTFGDDEMILVQ